jgi:hypothetical protein
MEVLYNVFFFLLFIFPFIFIVVHDMIEDQMIIIDIVENFIDFD